MAYDLEPAAKKLYPLITPLRNSISRVGGGVGTAVHWLSVTGINVARLSPGVSEGHRGGQVSLSTTSNMAAYKTLGHESFVTFEAEESGLPGTDNRALAILTTLQSLMQSEEMVLLGGNSDLALGQPPSRPWLSSPGRPARQHRLYGGLRGPHPGRLPGRLAARRHSVNIARANADGSTDTTAAAPPRRAPRPTSPPPMTVTPPTASRPAWLRSTARWATPGSGGRPRGLSS